MSKLSEKKYAITFWIALWLAQSFLMAGGNELEFYLIKNIAIVGLQFLVVQVNFKVLFPFFFLKKTYLLYIMLSILLVYIVFSSSFIFIDLIFEFYYPRFDGGAQIGLISDFWAILSGSSFYSLALVCSLVYKLLKTNQDKEATNQELQKRLENDEHNNPITIKEGHKTHQLLAKDIHFIKGLKEYVVWHTKNGNIVALQTLNTIEAEYKEMGFLRVHKSYIVNMNHVSSFKSNNLNVQGELIPIGRVFKKNVIEFLSDSKS
ncbi:LytR/AlgR family response regulator transcription factor [Spongiivirga citrea]|uniref:HTH LytTR-type domain-containing protein n=1 Tax=Spongiivirga citrea TaxID=1481457 RepID=A0A6M0CIL2_9FLAO|nr:LytTR family DNA-binding domain-containing protein [Spongiivirga citrea]NER17798.1 hypothetical protein [Spongiivirga citrea]